MKMEKYTFKPLTISDLNLLCEWFSNPHALEWWNVQLTPAEIKQKYGRCINDDIVHQYTAYLHKKDKKNIQNGRIIISHYYLILSTTN